MAVKAAASPSSPDSRTGASRYSSARHKLNKGGMGTIELATRREGRFARVYAIKRMSAGLSETQSGRTMFMDEARVAGLLRHPNVVSVLDVGEDDRGPYLVMDYVKGLDLSTIRRGLHTSNRHMPIDVALRILADAAAGLHAAHELKGTQGQSLSLVHRDVSPHNILVDFEGVVRLTDFGIAKSLGQSGKTSTGTLKGKIEYMAPEQLRFENVDRRSDIYALAVVAYEILAGKRLFSRETSNESAQAVLAGEIPDLFDVRDDVPPSLHELLLEMLANDRDRRPTTAAEVKRRIEAILRAWAVENGEPRDLAVFLTESFQDQKAQLETLYAAVLADAESSSASSSQSVIYDPVDAPPRERTPSRGVVVVAVVGLVVLGGLITWGLGLVGTNSASTTLAPPTDSEVEAELESEASVSASEPEPEREVEAEPEAEPEAEFEPIQAPTGTSRRRRRSLHMSAMSMTAEMAVGSLDGIWLPGQMR